MEGYPANKIHKKLQLYLLCSPALDLSFRFLPKFGGYYDQYYEDMMYFEIIERQIKNVMYQKSKVKRTK